MSSNDSPFVETEYVTFKYPAPLDEPPQKDETTTAHKLRTEKINPDQVGKDHWVRFRLPNSRGDVDRVADLTASRVISDGNDDGIKFESRIARGNKGVFELLIDSWSFNLRPDGSAYDKLGGWAGDWIIACMASTMEQGTTRDWAEKNGHSSTKPEPSVSELPSPEPEALASS